MTIPDVFNDGRGLVIKMPADFNETQQFLLGVFGTMIHRTNARARVRLLDMHDVTDRVMKSLGYPGDGGFVEVNGGVVGRSYNRPAATSVFSCAWYRNPAGVIQLHASAGRLPTRGGWCETAHWLPRISRKWLILKKAFAVLAEPRLYRLIGSLAQTGTPELLAFSDRLDAAPGEVATWLTLADWLEEHAANPVEWCDEVAQIKWAFQGPETGITRATRARSRLPLRRTTTARARFSARP